MGWRIVLQPNGLYARFSEFVDDFTDYDMTFYEAYELCRELAGRNVAHIKMNNADMELDPRTNKPMEPLSRWRECLERIKSVHGVIEKDIMEIDKFTGGRL